MPYASEKQRRWMYANRPDIAKRWAAEGHNYVEAGHKSKKHHAVAKLAGAPK